MTNDTENTTSVGQSTPSSDPQAVPVDGIGDPASATASPSNTGLWQQGNARVRDAANRALAAAPQPAKDAFDKAVATAGPQLEKVRVYRVHISTGLGVVLAILIIRRLAGRRAD